MSDENFPLPKEKWKKNPFSSEVFPEDMLNTKGIIRSLAYEQGTNDFLTMEKETKWKLKTSNLILLQWVLFYDLR